MIVYKIKPEFVKTITEDLFDYLKDNCAWINKHQNTPRDECFMSLDDSLSYSYGKPNQNRTYSASKMPEKVVEIMKKLNEDFKTNYNVCVGNYYRDEHQHLGWHADDSPEQDLQYPIAVISFGAERFIYFKKKEVKGNLPEENKQLLTNGSLFVIPGGFQDNHFHKIPKHSAKCGGRISLTFRKLDR